MPFVLQSGISIFLSFKITLVVNDGISWYYLNVIKVTQLYAPQFINFIKESLGNLQKKILGVFMHNGFPVFRANVAGFYFRG